jgi:predicted permease
MRSLPGDLKFALRAMRRSPLFTGVAVLSLALGIGANTAIFTLIDQLILRLLPVADPEQLVMIWSTGPHLGNNRGSRASSYPMYQEYAGKAEVFSYVFCEYQTPLSISVGNQTERVAAELVSGNYFQALGVKAAVGRVFSPEEDDRVYKGHPSVVLSHTYWVNRFRADPKIVGQKILVNNYPMVVVGVSAPGFVGLDPSSSPQIRVPIQMKPLMTPGWDALGDRRSQWIHMFGRMKPGFTVASARASLEPMFHRIIDDDLHQPELKDVTPYLRDKFVKRSVRMEAAGTGYSQMRQSGATALIVLMCMVGMVLLIACSNVAGLLVARAAARQREIAVRLSIGASRGQLIRQLVVESLLLSVAGGALAIVLSMWIVQALLSFIPQGGATMVLSATPDWRILGFTFALAVLSGLLFGLVPAFQALRVDPWNSLKDASGAVAGTAGASVRLRKTLVAAQVALSFLLLAGAGLFVKTLANLKASHTGFRDADRLVSFQVDPSLNGYSAERTQAFFRQLQESIRATPGVKSAAYSVVPVLAGDEWDSTMSVEGHKSSDGEDMQAFMNSVSEGYWDTMGVPLIEGRDFDRRDFKGKRFSVAIVNRKFAEHFFGKRSAVGRHIGFGDGPKSKLDIEIVGVAENTLYEGPREGVHRQVFVLDQQNDTPGYVAFYVRTALDPAAMVPALRHKVAELDPAMPVYEVKTLERRLDETLATERLIATLSAAFGVLATLLASIGLYGVMAFVVARRSREIGLRMALGARRGQVVWLVMREVLTLLGAGLVVGVPAAYLLSRYVSSQLFGVQPADPSIGAIALLVLAGVALAAGFLPARRASTLDPVSALRYE